MRFESYGYPFGSFLYSKFDRSFLNSVPLKLHFRHFEILSEEKSFLFADGKKLFLRLMRIPSGIFRHLEIDGFNNSGLCMCKKLGLLKLDRGADLGSYGLVSYGNGCNRSSFLVSLEDRLSLDSFSCILDVSSL